MHEYSRDVGQDAAAALCPQSSSCMNLKHPKTLRARSCRKSATVCGFACQPQLDFPLVALNLVAFTTSALGASRFWAHPVPWEGIGSGRTTLELKNSISNFGKDRRKMDFEGRNCWCFKTMLPPLCKLCNLIIRVPLYHNYSRRPEVNGES